MYKVVLGHFHEDLTGPCMYSIRQVYCCVENSGVTCPQYVGNEHDGRQHRKFCEFNDCKQDNNPEDNNFHKCNEWRFQTEKQRCPQDVENQLCDEKSEGDFHGTVFQSPFPNQKGG